jgi:predicted alpha-1,6-mannanase (GH76 family)
MAHLLLTFLIFLLISLSATAQETAPEITDLLLKYRKIQSGKISWKETSISSFVNDSSNSPKIIILCKDSPFL